jgi:hypothetical protein
VIVALAVLARTIIAAEQASEPVRNRLSRGMRQYSNLVHGWLHYRENQCQLSNPGQARPGLAADPARWKSAGAALFTGQD